MHYEKKNVMNGTTGMEDNISKKKLYNWNVNNIMV